MSKGINSNVVWIVSFEVDAAGNFLDYAVEQFDLREHSGSADKLNPLLGKGVFESAEEAKLWAEKQFSNCNTGCSGCGGGCCHGKNHSGTGDEKE
ncbi:hypothetical protein SDC9_11330 [bioreactor metagenome]|uniref:Uncharacterized protein n=1 Tax=bioreactor metagenome TaxID=1076179 RepID=A0A644TFB9_9ZZZZ|nr:hypothetical protein [Negativicutes bacterium]